MDDCLIIGGGVIGLSLAYTLADGGWRVRVVDRGQPGQEASWAAAGLIPPPPNPPNPTPLERLTALSCSLYPELSAKLRAETGIDNGYLACGGINLADQRYSAGLATTAAEFQRVRARVEDLSPESVVELEPAFQAAFAAGQIDSAILLPEETQFRNPRHMKALEAACRSRGVEISSNTEIEDFDISGDRIQAARTKRGSLTAKRFCITSGTWSGRLLERLGMQATIKPIRGQIVLLKSKEPLLRRVVYIGPHYFVPRADGRTLVGSTVEDVGFDCRSTPDGVRELLDFALEWLPQLRTAEVERSWAGLRPGSVDGAPYLGSIPGMENAFIATGHFRSGLILAPATALVMAQLMRGEKTAIDLEPFRVDREAIGVR
jgi:glycine oxidase